MVLDRQDMSFMREEFARQSKLRAEEVKDEGGLLNPQQGKQLMDFLTSQCQLAPAVAKTLAQNIVDKASVYKPEKPGDILRDALEGHVAAPYLKNKDNLKDVTAMLGGAMDALEQRLEARSAKAPAAATTTAAPPPKRG